MCSADGILSESDAIPFRIFDLSSRLQCEHVSLNHEYSIYRKQKRFHNHALMCITQYTFNSFLVIYAKKNAQFKFTDDHKNENEIAVKDIVMSLHSLSRS